MHTFGGHWQDSLIISDWDDTMTQGDTLGLLFKAAYLRKPNFPLKHSHYVNIYMEAYDSFQQAHKLPTTYENEVQYQTELEPVELSSVAECMQTGLFRDVLVSDFEAMSKSVVAKGGLDNFLYVLKTQRIPLHVVSVTWTSQVIKEYVKGFDVSVHSNELEFSGQRSTGSLFGQVRTGVDKLRITKNLMENRSGPVIYIGDSSTDVLSMFEADLAFVMAGGSATSTLERLGCSVKNTREAVSGDKFVVVSDWNELLWFIEKMTN